MYSVPIFFGPTLKKSTICFCLNAENSADAAQLKESMDLYEEIVTEEQQNRESTYFEVLFCFITIIIIIIIISSTGSSNVISSCITTSFDSVIPCVCFQLMSRFQAAQSQIKELHKRLEQMELQVFAHFVNFFENINMKCLSPFLFSCERNELVQATC